MSYSGESRKRSAIVDRSVLMRDTEFVARNLLGCRLVSMIGDRLVTGLVVETEAYLPEGDSACHSGRGETPGNRSMFAEAGTAYVYPIHSRYCFNVTTGRAGVGTAVLIRALKPLKGIDTMVDRRETSRLVDLCRGPARLCAALGIDRTLDGHDLTLGKRLWLAAGIEIPEAHVKRTTRVGVTSAEDRELRFVLRGSRYASGTRRLNR